MSDSIGNSGSRSSGSRRRRRHSKSSGKRNAKSRSYQPNRFIRSFRRLVEFLRNSQFLAALPIMLLLLSTSTDYYVALEGRHNLGYVTFGNLPTRVEPDVIGRDAAETIKTKVQAPIFLFIIGMSLLYFTKLLRFSLSIPILFIIPAYLFTTTFQSESPDRVVLNVILLIIAILAAAILAINQYGREKYLHTFYLIIFIPFFLHQSASLMLFISLDFSIVEFIASENRVGGFSGNPNTLANQAVIAIWASVSLFLSQYSRVYLRVVCIFALVIAGINILMSGSGTGLLVGALLVLIFVAFNLISRMTGRSQILFTMALSVFCIFGFAVFVSLSSFQEILVITTDSLGKDSTLTGRVDLWYVAIDAIKEKFIFGWGYDSHSSVFSTRKYSIEPLGHFHNGFIDSLVSGGFVFLFLIFLCFATFIKRAFIQWQIDSYIFPLIIAFLLLVLLNLSEYSLVRPNSQIWLIFLCSLSYVVVRDSKIGISAMVKPIYTSQSNSLSSRRNIRKYRK